jgi:hypothetical protein
VKDARTVIVVVKTEVQGKVLRLPRINVVFFEIGSRREKFVRRIGRSIIGSLERIRRALRLREWYGKSIIAI